MSSITTSHEILSMRSQWRRREQFSCPKGHLSETYRHRVRVRIRLGLASNLGICTTPFWTNEPSNKSPADIKLLKCVHSEFDNFCAVPCIRQSLPPKFAKLWVIVRISVTLGLDFRIKLLLVKVTDQSLELFRPPSKTVAPIKLKVFP